MINYDFMCKDCGHVYVDMITYEQRLNKFDCPSCGGVQTSERVFLTAPQIRTAKTSASYLDPTSVGGSRPKSEGLDDLKKAHELELKALKLNPKSEEYKALKKEAKDRVKIDR